MIILRLFGLLLIGTVLLRAPAHASNVASEAQLLQGQNSKQVLPRPTLRMSWNRPEDDFWVTGETPDPARNEFGQVVSAVSTGTIGARRRVLYGGGISLSTIPLVRSVTGWRDDTGEAHQEVGFALFQELKIALPSGANIRARVGVGDRTGVSVFNPHGTLSGMAVRAEAGISAGVGSLGGVSTRLDLQLNSTQAFGTGVGEERAPSSCELKLEIQRKGTAPLRIGGSCPGAPGEGRITFGIGGRF